MESEHKPFPVRQARFEAVMNMIAKNPRVSTDKLVRAADKAERKITEKTGRRSESKFFEYIFSIDGAKSCLQTAPGTEGIDAWIICDSKLNLPLVLPVQIKSSKKSFEDFKNIDTNETYKNLGGLILVFCMNDCKSIKNFRKAFSREAEKVREKLNKLDKEPTKKHNFLEYAEKLYQKQSRDQRSRARFPVVR